MTFLEASEMKYRSFKHASGMTLTEIMLAMALLASAFIPIMGVLGTSMKATDKDDRTIKAVNICIEKMNRALQFPFGVLEPVPPATTRTIGGVASQTVFSDVTTNAIALHLGPDTISGMPVTSELIIQDLPGVFMVPTFDDTAKLDNPNNPALWNWTAPQAQAYSGVHYKYTLTVRWRDKGSEEEKFYTLTSSKAKVRR